MAQHQGIRRQTTGSRTGVSGGPPSREIPDKLYFRIGEVAALCDVPAYVLRFWETEFPQLKPNKGGTGQRLFRRRDVEVALRIKRLLYDEGYTIPGARQLLKSEARQTEPQLSLLGEASASGAERRARLSKLRRDLEALLALLEAPPGQALASPGGDRSRSGRSVRRTALQAVPSGSERLFDFPGSSSARSASPEDTEEDRPR